MPVPFMRVNPILTWYCNISFLLEITAGQLPTVPLIMKKTSILFSKPGITVRCGSSCCTSSCLIAASTTAGTLRWGRRRTHFLTPLSAESPHPVALMTVSEIIGRLIIWWTGHLREPGGTLFRYDTVIEADLNVSNVSCYHRLLLL